MISKERFSKYGKNISNYFLLICFGYVFIYPLLYAISMSFMSYEDKLNPLVHLIPTQMSLSNYMTVFDNIQYTEVLIETIIISVACALAQTLACGIIGYGFGKYEFRFKKLFLALIIMMFVIPTQIVSMPTYLLLRDLNLINTSWALILPALFGQGLKSSIFILIYYQVFQNIPKSIDEAAQVDGAGPLTRFVKISAPLAKPAILLTFLFSVVWYWNETYLTSMYAGNAITTLPMQLRMFVSSLNQNIMMDGPLKMFETIEMAAVIITILPLVIMYMFLQKHFTESIDNTGITGE